MNRQRAKTILLVEDEALVAMSESRQLKKYGYEVVTAPNGTAAIEAAREKRDIDLILMDIDLGSGMDGTEAAAVILQEREMPVVFLSSHSEPAVVEKTEKITSYGYVVKDTGITVLDASIKMAFKLFEANRKIQHANETLALAQTAGHAGAWDWDIVHDKFSWSPEFIELFGLAADVVPGFEAWMKTVHPADRDAAARRIREAIDRKTDLVNEYRIVMPGGGIRWIQATGKTHYSGDRPLRMIGLCTDITERMRGEEQLRASEERYRVIYDQSPIAIELYDSGGILVAVNPSCRALFGVIDEEDLRGFDLFGDPNVDEVFKERLRRGETVRYQAPFDFDKVAALNLYRTTRSGSIWLDVLITPLGSGLPLGYLVQIQDIAERIRSEHALRESEERYRAILDSSLVGIGISYGVEIVYANRALLDMFGYGSLEEFSAKSLLEHAAPESRQAILERIDRLRAGEPVDPVFEQYIDRPDGERRSLQLHIAKITYAGRECRLSTFIDVTERKRYEEELRASEVRYRKIADSVTDYMYSVTVLGGRAVSTSHGTACASVTGYSREDYEADPGLWLRMVHQEDRPAVERQAADLLAGDAYPLEHRIIHRDGSLRWVRNTPVPHYGGDGELIGYDGLMAGITVRKEAELQRERAIEELRASEERLRLAMMATNDVIWDWDIVNDTQRWSESGAAVFGWEEIVSSPQSAAWWVERVHPDDRERVHRGFFAVVEDPARSIWQDEYRFRRAEGSYAIVMDRGYVLRDAGGTAVRMIGAMQDVTERIRIHEELREKNLFLQSLFDSSPMAIFCLDRDARVTLWSPSAERIFGWTGGEVLERLNPIIPPEKEGEFHSLFSAIIDEGNTIIAKDVRRTRKDGELIDVSLSVSPLRNAGGEIIGAVGMMVDVTEHRRLERLLDESQRQITLMAELLEHSDQSFGVAYPDGRLGSCNDAFPRMLGYGKEEFMALDWVEDITPMEWHGTEAVALARLRETGRPERYEKEYIRKDGTRFPVEVFVHLARDPRGEPLHYYAFVTDITERKRMEQSLQRSADRFRLLADTAGQLLRSTDPRGLVESLCRRVMEQLECHAFFNYLADPAAGRLHLNAFAGIPEEEARRIEWLEYGVAVCGSVARDACRIVAERIPDTPDPRTELVRSYGIRAYACHPLFGEGGSVIGTLSFGTKSRETFGEEELPFMKAVADQVSIAMVRVGYEEALRESEVKFRTIADFTADWEYWLGIDGSFVYVSPSCREITGYGPEDFSGDPSLMLSVVKEEDRNIIRDHLDGTRVDSDAGTVDFRIVTRDGRERWIAHRCRPVFGHDGSHLGRRGSNRDVTERVRAEMQREAALQELAGAVRERESLLRELQHRVKNNLFMITSLIDLEAEKALSEDAVSSLGKLRDRIASLGNLYALLHRTGSVERVRIDEYIADVVAALAQTHGTAESGIEMVVQCEPVEVSVQSAAP
ncbi:MAG: PAS domain S-box protein, partial [Spirochaetes bacterium]|nr:PAS domain S-box protein [Spirochaetota bacterium]